MKGGKERRKKKRNRSNRWIDRHLKAVLQTREESFTPGDWKQENIEVSTLSVSLLVVG